MDLQGEPRRVGVSASDDASRSWRDMRFLADLAQRMRSAETYRSASAEDAVIRIQIAGGTLDAALWLLGITDLAPASKTVRVDRRPAALWDEASTAAAHRRSMSTRDPEWLYWGGVLDALAFELGDEEAFWWVPLPLAVRAGPPERDEYGREIS